MTYQPIILASGAVEVLSRPIGGRPLLDWTVNRPLSTFPSVTVVASEPVEAAFRPRYEQAIPGRIVWRRPTGPWQNQIAPTAVPECDGELPDRAIVLFPSVPFRKGSTWRTWLQWVQTHQPVNGGTAETCRTRLNSVVVPVEGGLKAVHPYRVPAGLLEVVPWAWAGCVFGPTTVSHPAEVFRIPYVDSVFEMLNDDDWAIADMIAENFEG